MATPRKSPYEKFWTRYVGTTVDVLIDPEPSERLLRRWSDLELRRQHWESHETELDGCTWCDRYPPLSR